MTRPYRRFADTLANANARLGADADRYSFTVERTFTSCSLPVLIGAPEVKIYVSKSGH